MQLNAGMKMFEAFLFQDCSMTSFLGAVKRRPKKLVIFYKGEIKVFEKKEHFLAFKI